MKILSPLTITNFGTYFLVVFFVTVTVSNAANLQPEDYLRKANDELQKEIQLLTNAQWDLASNITPANEAKVVSRT